MPARFSASVLAHATSGGVPRQNPQIGRMKTGLFGRGGIQLLPRRPALLGQDIGHVEDSTADRRSAWSQSIRRAASGARARRSDPGCRGSSARAERRKHALQSFPVHMRMAVDQARHDRTSLQIEDARVRRDMRIDLRGGAYCEDSVTGDRDRSRDREPGIDGNDLRVRQNNVGGPGHGQIAIACASRRWSATATRPPPGSRSTHSAEPKNGDPFAPRAAAMPSLFKPSNTA